MWSQRGQPTKQPWLHQTDACPLRRGYVGCVRLTQPQLVGPGTTRSRGRQRVALASQPSVDAPRPTSAESMLFRDSGDTSAPCA
jgi:hypothetical protein